MTTPSPYPAPVPPPVPPQPGLQKTSLPLWSLILGILSLIQCLPIVGGVLAIIFGFMGKKRAREYGQSSGQATAGIVLGILGILINVVLLIALLAGGLKLAGFVVNQSAVAQQLAQAETAATAYGQARGSYDGLTTEALASYGYVPQGGYTITAMPVKGGTSFCIQGSSDDHSDTLIHVPPTGESTVTITIGNETYRYALGACPAR